MSGMDETFSKWQPLTLSLFRFITGLMLFQYGVAKLLNSRRIRRSPKSS